MDPKYPIKHYPNVVITSRRHQSFGSSVVGTLNSFDTLFTSMGSGYPNWVKRENYNVEWKSVGKSNAKPRRLLPRAFPTNEPLSLFLDRERHICRPMNTHTHIFWICNHIDYILHVEPRQHNKNNKYTIHDIHQEYARTDVDKYTQLPFSIDFSSQLFFPILFA